MQMEEPGLKPRTSGYKSQTFSSMAPYFYLQYKIENNFKNKRNNKFYSKSAFLQEQYLA